MKPVIIYHSQTGFTKQYAKWMAEELLCPYIAFEKKDTIDFSQYDTILFGSWCHAGQLKKIRWFREILPQWQEKQKVLFAVGASPAENPEVESFLKTLSALGKDIKAFYLPGGLRYERMGAVSKAMMKLFASVVNKKKEKTPEEETMARMIRQSYDISDRSYTIPILESLRETKHSQAVQNKRN
ncbi:MAG: flavodoxin [Lachnospiraceae bacterium]|nr:flavodoxin [Lachnospiraceae bacterium]